MVCAMFVADTLSIARITLSRAGTLAPVKEYHGIMLINQEMLRNE